MQSVFMIIRMDRKVKVEVKKKKSQLSTQEKDVR